MATKKIIVIILIVILVLVGAGAFIYLQGPTEGNNTNHTNNLNLEIKSLTKVKQIDVTPIVDGEKILGHRPDVVKINDKLYILYDYPENKKTNVFLLVLNKDLSQDSFASELFSGGEGMPTDIRTATDGENFFYGIENVKTQEDICTLPNQLGLAIYDTKNISSVLLKENIANGAPAFALATTCPPGVLDTSFAVDDPTPFYYNSNYCLGIRKNTSPPTLQIYCFDLDGESTIANEINFSSLVGETKALSQSAITIIDNEPWLITGAATGPPSPENSSSIYAIKLSSSLSEGEEAIEIVPAQGNYFTRVVSAKQYGNNVLITYVKQSNDRSNSRSKVYLAAFDFTKNFEKVAEAVVLEQSIADDHMPLEIIGDKVYIFHQLNDSDSAIVAEVFDVQ